MTPARGLPQLVAAILGCLLLFARGAIADDVQPAATDTCAAGATAMARSELLFGMRRDGLAPIGKSAWARFLDQEIAPRFPDGFTILDGLGEWRGRRGVIHETSHVLIIWHRRDPALDEKIEALRSIYKKRFQQESVMRVDGNDCVSF